MSMALDQGAQVLDNAAAAAAAAAAVQHHQQQLLAQQQQQQQQQHDLSQQHQQQQREQIADAQRRIQLQAQADAVAAASMPAMMPAAQAVPMHPDAQRYLDAQSQQGQRSLPGNVHQFTSPTLSGMMQSASGLVPASGQPQAQHVPMSAPQPAQFHQQLGQDHLQASMSSGAASMATIQQQMPAPAPMPQQQQPQHASQAPPNAQQVLPPMPPLNTAVQVPAGFGANNLSSGHTSPVAGGEAMLSFGQGALSQPQQSSQPPAHSGQHAALNGQIADPQQISVEHRQYAPLPQNRGRSASRRNTNADESRPTLQAVDSSHMAGSNFGEGAGVAVGSQPPSALGPGAPSSMPFSGASLQALGTNPVLSLHTGQDGNLLPTSGGAFAQHAMALPMDVAVQSAANAAWMSASAAGLPSQGMLGGNEMSAPNSATPQGQHDNSQLTGLGLRPESTPKAEPAMASIPTDAISQLASGMLPASTTSLNLIPAATANALPVASNGFAGSGIAPPLQNANAPATQPIMTTQLPHVQLESQPGQGLSGPSHHRRQHSQPQAGQSLRSGNSSALGAPFQSPGAATQPSHLQMTQAHMPIAPSMPSDAQVGNLLEQVAKLAIAGSQDVRSGQQLRPGYLEGLQQIIARLHDLSQHPTGPSNVHSIPNTVSSDSSVRTRIGSSMNRHSHNESTSTVLSSEGSPLLKKRPHFDEEVAGPTKSLRSENGTPVHPTPPPPPPPASAPPTALQSPTNHGPMPMSAVPQNLSSQPPNLLHTVSESQVPQLHNFQSNGGPMSVAGGHATGQAPLPTNNGNVASHINHRLAMTNQMNASTASLGSVVPEMHQPQDSLGRTMPSSSQSTIETPGGLLYRDPSLDLANIGLANAVKQRLGAAAGGTDGNGSVGPSHPGSGTTSGVHSPVGPGLRSIPSHNSLNLGFLQQAKVERAGLANEGAMMPQTQAMHPAQPNGDGAVGGMSSHPASTTSQTAGLPHSTPLQQSFTLPPGGGGGGATKQDGQTDESMDDSAHDSALSSMIFLSNPSGQNGDDQQATLRASKPTDSGHNSLAQVDFSMHDEAGDEKKGGATAPAPVPIEPELQAKLDVMLQDFLSRLCSNLEAKDNRGELIHQALMLKKMRRLDESPNWRPFKFRIQAFTNAFYSDLQEKGIPDEEVSFKKMKQFLWANPYISRYNDDGRKAKSKGNHVWMVSARKVTDPATGKPGWMFRKFERKIAGAPEDLAYIGVEWIWEMRIWDPQAPSDSIKAKFIVEEHPEWLHFDGVSRLSGVPKEGDKGGRVSVTANYTQNKEQHTLRTSFVIDLRQLASASAPRLSPSDQGDYQAAQAGRGGPIRSGNASEYEEGEGEHSSVASSVDLDDGSGALGMSQYQDDSAMYLPFEPGMGNIMPTDTVSQTMAALNFATFSPASEGLQTSYPFDQGHHVGNANAAQNAAMNVKHAVMNQHALAPGHFETAVQAMQQQHNAFVLGNPPGPQMMPSQGDFAQVGPAQQAPPQQVNIQAEPQQGQAPQPLPPQGQQPLMNVMAPLFAGQQVSTPNQQPSGLGQPPIGGMQPGSEGV